MVTMTERAGKHDLMTGCELLGQAGEPKLLAEAL